MTVSINTKESLSVEIGEKIFELSLPKDFKVTEAYEATMTMSAVLLENLIKGKAELEAKEPKEEVVSEEVLPSAEEKGEE